MMKDYLKKRKYIMSYLRTHVEYNAAIHMLGGIGLGIVITSPLLMPHPVRWALAFLAVSLLGHLYPLFTKKR